MADVGELSPVFIFFVRLCVEDAEISNLLGRGAVSVE